MKKRYLMMVGLMAVSAAYAGQSAAPAKVEVQATLSDEQTFVAKLGEVEQKIFALMNAEQRKAVVAAAKDAATANAAVEKVMKEQKIALVDGQLKSETK